MYIWSSSQFWLRAPKTFDISLTVRKWQPIPVLLPGESHGWRSLVGYSPQGRKESDTTEGLHLGTYLRYSKVYYMCTEINEDHYIKHQIY